MTWLRPSAVLLALLLGALAPQGKELLANGGFESGLAGWRPLDMSKSTTFELDSKVKHAGKQSLRMERKGPGAPDFLKASVDLPARRGKIAFSVAWQVARDSRVRIDAYFFDAAGETVGKGFMTLADAKTTKKFEVGRAEYEIPSKATGFGINVVMEKPGTAWIDSASVVLVADPKAPRKKAGSNLLDNGTFDDDLEGWSEVAHGSGTAEVGRDKKVKGTGAAALRIERAGPRIFPEDGMQATVLDPGDARRFELAFKSRVDGDASAFVVLQAFDELGAVISTLRAPCSRAAMSAGALKLELEAPCGRLVVTLAVRGTGTAWLDDVVLEGR